MTSATVMIYWLVWVKPCLITELLRQADQALYQAKHAGRNRVETTTS